MSAHRFLMAAAALAMGTLSDHAAESDVLTPQARKDFEWFSTLGFADLKGCPYVRVATGGWSRSGDDPPQQQFMEGFLLATNTSGFKMFTLSDLYETTFIQSNPATKQPTTIAGYPRTG